MAANKVQRFGPVALTTTLTTNILNPAAAGAGAVGYVASASYIILRRISIVNKTATAATFSFWIGATGANAAGTEFLGTAISIPPNSTYERGVFVRLDAADFLVGGASANTSLTFEAEGEVGLS
jgi:hypothetical protein